MLKVQDTEYVFGLLVFKNVSHFFNKEMQKAMKILVAPKRTCHL